MKHRAILYMNICPIDTNSRPIPNPVSIVEEEVIAMKPENSEVSNADNKRQSYRSLDEGRCRIWGKLTLDVSN